MYQRFTVLKNYVTEGKAADGYNLTGFNIALVQDDGTLQQLDYSYDSEEQACERAYDAIAAHRERYGP